ncbi:DUF4340 domain-containing protein [Thiocystis violacea]|uniref:DUF4340 domain-containing protein n=1 Tax=Thiocystis violacea TaxID=13725 RepID=UPI001F5B37CF|nr:DUF4340 domain-containing protein [Thiocystis violacea]
MAPSTKADLGWGRDLRSPGILGLLLMLALQLLIALGFSLSDPGAAAFTPQAPLIALTPKEVTRITIEGPDDEGKVQLSRKAGGEWVIANLADLPVTATKVDQLLEQVTALKRPLPIGTSEDARKRFKVADDGYVRRLTLEGADGQSTTLVLGETPGFRRIFGRTADDSEVYDLPLALSDVSNRRDDWAQTGLLKLDQEKISSVSGKDWTLTKNEQGWSLAESTEPLDEGAAKALVAKVANLGYRGVLGTEDDPAYHQQEPVLELSIQLDDGGTRAYRISKAEDGEDYVLKDAARPYYFKLSTFDLEGLLDLDRSKLIVQPEAPKAEAASEPPAPQPADTPEPTETSEPEASTSDAESAPSESPEAPAQVQAPATETPPPPAPPAQQAPTQAQ